MTALETLRDALARVVGIRDAHAVGDACLAEQMAEDLERDLANWIARLEAALAELKAAA